MGRKLPAHPRALGLWNVGTLRFVTAVLLSISTASGRADSGTNTSSMPRKVDAVAKHYGKEIDAGGGWGKWRVLTVAAKPRNSLEPQRNTIVVTIAIPDRDAKQILSRPADAQLRAVGYSACPSRGAPIWEALSAEDNIEVQAAYGGHVFIDVPCRFYAVGVERKRTPSRATGAEPTKASESIYEQSVLQATTSDGLTRADLAWHAINTYGWDCTEVVRRDPPKGDYYLITCSSGKKLRVYPRPGEHPRITNINGGYN